MSKISSRIRLITILLRVVILFSACGNDVQNTEDINRTEVVESVSEESNNDTQDMCVSEGDSHIQQEDSTSEDATDDITNDMTDDVIDNLIDNVTEDAITEENTDKTDIIVSKDESTQNKDNTSNQDNTINKNNTTNKNSTNNKNNTSNKNNNQKVEFDYQSLGYETYEDFINHCTLVPDEATEKAMAQAIVEQIITKNMSEFDKVKAINDYMILNVRYDRENYAKDTIPATSYTAFGAMETGVAVCAGYAKMFSCLAEASGLDVRYITGSAGGPHAWNQVKVDGKWYNIDVTWNDGDVERHENGHYYCGCYQYFLISNELLEQTHTTNYRVEECKDNLDLQAILEGCPYSPSTVYCQTQEDVTAQIKNMVKDNQTSVQMIVDKSNTLKDMVVKALAECKIYDSYKINVKRDFIIYRESKNLDFVTVTIEINAESVEELIVQAATTEKEAKTHLIKGFKNAQKYTIETQDSYVLYVNDKLAADKYFLAKLITWAFYEHDIKMDAWSEWESIDENVNGIKLKFTTATEENLTEYAYSVDELDTIIKRMKDHGIKSAGIKLFENNHLLVGDTSNEKRNHFINTYCKELIAKYCLTIGISGPYDDENAFWISIDSYGHDTEYVYWEEYVIPTCATEGLNVKYCRICGQIAEKQVVETNDSHTYCWEVNEKTRTLKCKACSYSGITEVCVDGIWGYYDNAKALEYVKRINAQRANIWIGVSDDFGNPIGVISPPQLTIDETLTQKAETRVIELIKSDFAHDTLLKDEAFSNARYYPNNKYVRSAVGGVDLYDENYSVVGVACFCVDRDDSGFNFLDQYVFEFSK